MSSISHLCVGFFTSVDVKDTSPLYLYPNLKLVLVPKQLELQQKTT